MKIKFDQIPELKKKSLSSDFQKFHCENDRLEAVCFKLKNQYGYLWLNDLVAISIDHQLIELNYYFYYIEGDDQFCISLRVEDGVPVKSIAHMWANASELEQEVFEFFGVKFSRNYLNQYFVDENNVFPMLKDEVRSPVMRSQEIENVEDNNFVNPFLNLQIEMVCHQENSFNDSYKILSGNYHLGIEKMLESMSVRKAISIIENYYPRQGTLYSLAFFQGLEESLNVVVPERVMALRMIVVEFQRVLDHFSYMQEICMELGYNSFLKNLMIWSQRIQALIISFSGNEYFANLNRLGGLNRDVDQSWLSRVMDEIDDIDGGLNQEYKTILKSNKLRELLSFHIIDKYEATSRSLTGPVARAAGLNFDYRKSHPHYFYGDVEFEVPVGTEGTAFDLLVVRIEEVFQSFKIIIQVLDNLPSGAILYDGFEDILKMKGKTNFFDDKLYLKGVEESKIFKDVNIHSLLEGPNGIIGVTSIIKDSHIDRFRFQANDPTLRKVFEYNSKNLDIDTMNLSWLALGVNMKMVEK